MTATPKVREALEFYAKREHIAGMEDWEAPSGEPPNWLCPPTEDSWMVEDGSLAREALSLLDQPAARGMGEIDVGAISWAYHKLLAFGCQNTSMDNALMLDRLNLMLQGAYQESPDA